MDYQEANATLGKRDSRKLGNNTYLQRRLDGTIAVKLHATDVLTFREDGATVYQSGGWRTVTTKDRMNAYGPLRLYSERGIWYALKTPCDWDGPRVVYDDGLTVHADGRIEGAGDASSEREDKRAVKRFVTAYMDALEAGKVPAPGAGDCFYCGMREVETERPLGEVAGDQRAHILGHFSEPYYVPSMLARALEMFGASQSMRWWVSSWWAPIGTDEERQAARRWNERDRCAKALRRYLLRQLGYAS